MPKKDSETVHPALGEPNPFADADLHTGDVDASADQKSPDSFEVVAIPRSPGTVVARWVFAFLGCLILCPLLLHFGREYGTRAWDSLRLVNTIVNLTPTFLAILFAFVVDKDLAGRMRWRWAFRIFVFLCGLGLSGLLWHQQDLADQENTRQTNQAIAAAVHQANEHSDEKFGDVQKQVTGIGTSLDQTQQSLQSRLNKAETDIDASIGKVGKPEPPEHSKLIFSLWNENGLSGSEFPLKSETLTSNVDGSYHVEFLIKNSSSAQAQAIEEWVDICDACSFASEPRGFEKPKGMRDQERHRSIPGLNPGVTLIEGNEFDVIVPKWIARFEVVFKATCSNCGAVTASEVFSITKSSYTMPRQ